MNGWCWATTATPARPARRGSRGEASGDPETTTRALEEEIGWAPFADVACPDPAPTTAGRRASWGREPPSTCTPICARWTPRRRGCPIGSSAVAGARPLRRSRDRTGRPSLEEALYQDSWASSGPSRRWVPWCRHPRSPPEQVEALGHRRDFASPAGPAAQGRRRGPRSIIADLAREIRYRYFDQPVIEARTAAVYAEAEAHLTSSRGPPRPTVISADRGAGRLPAAAGPVLSERCARRTPRCRCCSR